MKIPSPFFYTTKMASVVWNGFGVAVGLQQAEFVAGHESIKVSVSIIDGEMLANPRTFIYCVRCFNMSQVCMIFLHIYMSDML